MRRRKLLVPALFLVLAAASRAADVRGGGMGAGFARPSSVRQPVVINMSRPSSGFQNRNFPSQQAPRPAASRPQPSYGQLHWNAPTENQPRPQAIPPQGQMAPLSSRPRAGAYASPGVRAAVAVHHHPYTQGYVRAKLQKIGVTSEPSLITDRSEIINTDRRHSTIPFPTQGPGNAALSAVAVSRGQFSDQVVRDHMTLVDSPQWHDRINGFDASETERGHYYWHNDNFNYCHYIDNQGYNWWGWYVGDQFFWNRYFQGRWWWYDSDDSRWCFWNNGYWWWQDPNHVGDLYCYNNGDYIPCNSADDQVVVTAPDTGNFNTYTSPDGTRVVKVTTDTQDAFLYDTANPPSFEPVYLASGVESVSFSDPNNGRPMEIVLKLNDGTFDMFDGQGNSYGPGAFDEDQAAQAGASPAGF